MFSSEDVLVDRFVEFLESAQSPFAGAKVIREFENLQARTDVVAVIGGVVIAFEAKLKDWRTALHQATRNTSFAHRSYVVMPRAEGLVAHRYSAEFQVRGVGLCLVGDNGMEVLEEAPEMLAIEPWIADEAIAFANGVVQ
jgi:hypothetical protein